MATVTERVFQEQFGHLRQVAESRGWDLKRIDGPGFILVLPARDESHFALRVICDKFPSLPPIWNCYNTETRQANQLVDIPQGSGGYFHGSGIVSVLLGTESAYLQEDSQVPHSNWKLENWVTNSHTGQCTTLTAMALRMAVELASERYTGRKGQSC